MEGRGKRKKWGSERSREQKEGEMKCLPPGVVYVALVRILLIIISAVVVAIVDAGGHRRIPLLPVVVIVIIVVVVVVVVIAGGILVFWNSNQGSRRGWLTGWGL